MNKAGSIEYKMSSEMAKKLLKLRKGTELKQTPQEFLCAYVNQEFNLKGHCVRVLTDL